MLGNIFGNFGARARKAWLAAVAAGAVELGIAGGFGGFHLPTNREGWIRLVGTVIVTFVIVYFVPNASPLQGSKR
jgi:hypothetical protein